MIRELVARGDKYNKTGKMYKEFCGKSGDTKPTTNLLTGSTFYEVDTGKLYMFDEEATAGQEWIDQDFESGDW